MNDVKVKNVKVIFTEPDNIRLVIVKIDTNQPGLYGVGCATFTQRPTPVKAAIEDYLAPFIEGKNVNDIEDIWASSYVSSYWRNGPVLNNALSGIECRDSKNLFQFCKSFKLITLSKSILESKFFKILIQSLIASSIDLL